jgi:diguanylate cyclase (GGDEF)-like protein/PAS domain S-box-containing protein
MQWQITSESLLLIFSSVFVSVVALGLWWKRNTPGAKCLLGMMVASAIWCLASAIEYAAISPDVRIFASKLQYIGIYTLIPAYVMFGLGLSHIKRRVTRGFIIILWVIPIVTILLAFTNEIHGLIWIDITPVPESYGLVYHHGLGFWLATIFSYICLLAGSILVVYAAKNRLAASKAQISVILIAVIAPWVANILYITGLFPIAGIDSTPFAFAISGILFAFSIYQFQIFNITPIARDKVVDTMDDLLIVIDYQSQIVDLNSAAEQVLHVKRNAVIGQQASELLKNWPNLVYLFTGKFEGKTVTKTVQDKNEVWYNLRISPLQNRHGQMTGRMILLRDITDQKKQDEEVRRLANIINEVSEAIVLTDINGDILYANPFFEEVTGYKTEEVLGKNPRILKSNHQDGVFYEVLWNTITSGKTWRGNFINKRKDGSLYHEAAIIFPIKNSEGKITNYAAVKRDITEQMITEQAIKEREHQYRLLADNVTDVIWIMDLEGRFTYISPSIEQLTGYSPDEIIGDLVNDSLTPASLELVLPSLQKIFKAVQSGEKLIETPIFELEQRRKDGETVWIEAILNIMYDDDGQALGILGLTREITDRKKAQEKIQQTARQQQLLNEITYAAIRQTDYEKMAQILADRLGELFDADGCYITLWDETNQQAYPMTAYGSLRDSYRSMDLPKPNEPTLTKSVLDIGKPLAIPDVFHTPYLSPKIAAQFPAKSQLALPLIANNQKLGAALIAFNHPHDFSDEEIHLGEQAANQIALALLKARLLEEAEYLAVHDALTGLLNRRYFMEMARKEFSRSQRYHYPLSIIMFDIDHFKLVNDTYGHPAGDQVLQMIAQKCRENTRTSDIIGRYGGEEFIILLPETPIWQPESFETNLLAPEDLPAKSVATRLCQITEQASITTTNNSTIGVTISLGIAEMDSDCSDVERLINRADQALLEAKKSGRNAKKSGRNQVIIWNPK